MRFLKILISDNTSKHSAFSENIRTEIEHNLRLGQQTLEQADVYQGRRKLHQGNKKDIQFHLLPKVLTIFFY